LQHIINVKIKPEIMQIKYVITTLLFFSLSGKIIIAQIDNGYTNKLSYNLGDTVTFFTQSFQTNTQNSLFAIQDINNNIISNPINFTITNQPNANSNAPSTNGFNYTQTATWTIPSNLKSGMYFLNAHIPIPIIIKGNKATADIVVVCSTNREEAYTGSGGKSMYIPCTGCPFTDAAQIVSFKRPLDKSNFMDGFLKWFYNQTNYSNINVISDTDLDADYGEIENAKLVILIGHSEYWTRKARLNFDRFVDEGHHAMVLSGNSMWWQVRYQNDNGNPQMVCYRGSNNPANNPHDNGYADEPTEQDPLLWTYHWSDQELKYSILGSIGADFGADDLPNQKRHGGYCQGNDYQGFGGFFVTQQNSPLFNNTGLQYGSVIDNNFGTLSSGALETGELDGTVVTLDANNDPVLDIKALGFYRGEIVAFDMPAYSGTPRYAPIMAFQKTCSSGKVINVNSNYWCRPSHFLSSDPTVRTITQNMIDLLLGNSDDIWTNQSSPTVFSLKPNMAGSVCYSACSNGTISITPCGVQMQNGYKIDNASGLLSLGFDANCSTYQALRLATTTNSSSTDVLPVSSQTLPSNGKALNTSNPNNTIANDAAIVVSKFSIYPNPAKNTITLNLPTNQNTTVTFTDMLGNEVLVQNEKLKLQSDNDSSTEVSIEHLPKGIYFVTAKTITQQFVRKLVKE